MSGAAFRNALEGLSLVLARGETTALQVNTGFLCNLSCRHCHLEAGPGRAEVMHRDTMDAVIAAARRFPFRVIDLTGGSLEMVPDIAYLVSALAPLTPRLIVRTNLVGLHDLADDGLLALYRKVRAVVTASLPATNAGQTEAQRGNGVWGKCLAMLRRLNEAGYGRAGSGLELDLVANPPGAYLPAGQAETERRFRQELAGKHGITFDRLYTFANVPMGRYRRWLETSGNSEAYLRLLAERFNPATIPGLMCRTQLSVDWEGRLWDCDFNLAAGLFHGSRRTHISELTELPSPGTPIRVGDHCFACTAGSGFTCGGAIAPPVPSGLGGT